MNKVEDHINDFKTQIKGDSTQNTSMVYSTAEQSHYNYNKRFYNTPTPNNTTMGYNKSLNELNSVQNINTQMINTHMPATTGTANSQTLHNNNQQHNPTQNQ